MYIRKQILKTYILWLTAYNPLHSPLYAHVYQRETERAFLCICVWDNVILKLSVIAVAANESTIREVECKQCSTWAHNALEAYALLQTWRKILFCHWEIYEHKQFINKSVISYVPASCRSRIVWRVSYTSEAKLAKSSAAPYLIFQLINCACCL